MAARLSIQDGGKMLRILVLKANYMNGTIFNANNM